MPPLLSSVFEVLKILNFESRTIPRQAHMSRASIWRATEFFQ